MADHVGVKHNVDLGRSEAMLNKRYLLFAIILALAALTSVSGKATAAGPEHQATLYFDSESSKLKEASIQAVNRIIAELAANPAWGLIIEGHTDDSGKPETNLKLSVDRALTIRDLIAAGGIDPGRLDVQGKGQTQPLSDNNTPEGRALNRRVELYKVLPDSPQAVVLQPQYQFESVPEGREVVHEFRIQNKGTAPLLIEKVQTG
jgi:hypothetical protein